MFQHMNRIRKHKWIQMNQLCDLWVRRINIHVFKMSKYIFVFSFCWLNDQKRNLILIQFIQHLIDRIAFSRTGRTGDKCVHIQAFVFQFHYFAGNLPQIKDFSQHHSIFWTDYPITVKQTICHDFFCKFRMLDNR